jgi:hypothetical protein
VDGDQIRRWQGGDVDLTRPLPSDLILSAAQVDPRIHRAAPGYLGMVDLPCSLDPVEPLARAVFESGRRSGHGPRPTRDELVDLIEAADDQGG